MSLLAAPFQAIANRQSANATNAADVNNSQRAANEATYSEYATATNSLSQEQEAAKQLGSIRAAAGASGVTSGGSVQVDQENSAMFNRLKLLNIQTQGAAQTENYLSEATNYAAAGGSAENSVVTNDFAQGFGGAGSTAASLAALA